MSHLPFPIHSTVALVAVGDPSRDRTVYATIVLLVALGFTMIMLAVWLLRRTRPDPEVLAPLERMGERKWRRADPVWQRRHLDQVRPGGADPLEPTSAPPATDADFERGPQPIGFDDLVVSSTTSLATATGLPAPSGDVPSDDGPPDVGNGDEPAQGGGEAIGTTPDDVVGDDATNTGSGAKLVDAGEIDDVSSDAASGGDTEAGDDDDEDITGEQDTDDFLAVLEHEYELEHDVDPVVERESGAERDDDPEARSDLDPSGERVVETASDSDIDPVAPVDTEADVDPDRDPDVDHADEPDAVPGIALDVDDDERPDIEADVDALNDPGEVPEAQPDVDLDIGDDDEPG